MARMFFATMKNNLRKEIAFFSEYFTLEKKNVIKIKLMFYDILDYEQ